MNSYQFNEEFTISVWIYPDFTDFGVKGVMQKESFDGNTVIEL